MATWSCLGNCWSEWKLSTSLSAAWFFYPSCADVIGLYVGKDQNRPKTACFWLKVTVNEYLINVLSQFGADLQQTLKRTLIVFRSSTTVKEIHLFKEKQVYFNCPCAVIECASVFFVTELRLRWWVKCKEWYRSCYYSEFCVLFLVGVHIEEDLLISSQLERRGEKSWQWTHQPSALHIWSEREGE